MSQYYDYVLLVNDATIIGPDINFKYVISEQVKHWKWILIYKTTKSSKQQRKHFSFSCINN
jgi:hypothetical protein